jgi:hypothetical protein
MPQAVSNNGFQLQPRDLQILRGLLDGRVATIQQLSKLHFDGRLAAARKRVRKLKTAGVIYERRRRSTDPSVYCLGKRSIHFLESEGILADYPAMTNAYWRRRANVSELTLRHELDVTEVRAALTVAVRSAGCRVNEFTTWPRLIEFAVNQPNEGAVLVKPDGYIRIGGAGAEQRFFLEVDRSTERLDILTKRAACYRDYFLYGGFADRHGLPRGQYKRLPFVVLMTFKTAERRNNFAECLLAQKPPIRNQVWLTTIKEIIADPLGSIWVKPSEYLKAASGRAGNADRRGQPYRRQPDRDSVIESGVTKNTLLRTTGA